MGAAKHGWGQYFRNLHSKMHKEGTANTTARRMNRPPSRRRRKRDQRPPSLPPSSGATNDSSAFSRHDYKATNNLRQMAGADTTNIKSSINSHSLASMSSLTRQRRREREDGNISDRLATSRARAAKHQIEESMTRRMAIRLQVLWHELKIPGPDRAYVTAAYLDRGDFSGPGLRVSGGMGEAPAGGGRGGGDDGPTSEDIHRELARQIRLLLEHRAATVKVLRSVKARESRLNDVEKAFQAFQWHRGLDTDAVGVVVSLAGLRNASFEVVRAIEEWRTNLWQPRAFCWRGVNYFEKMSLDTDFLRSPTGESFLASVGLEADDMTFVLFPSARGWGAPSATAGDGNDDCSCGSKGSEAEENNGNDTLRPPPAIVRLSPKPELALEYRARYFERSPFGGADGGVRRQGSGSENGARRQLGKGCDGAAAVTAAAAKLEAVVVKEAELQKKVEAERVRLAAKGCFVPLLRWLPGDNKNAAPKGERRQPSSSNPPVPGAVRSTTPRPAAEMKDIDETPTADGIGDTIACSNSGRCEGVEQVFSDSTTLPSSPPTSGALPPPIQQQQQQQQQQQDSLPLTTTNTSASAILVQRSIDAHQKRTAILGAGTGHQDDEEEEREQKDDGQVQLQREQRGTDQTEQARVEVGDHTHRRRKLEESNPSSPAEVEKRTSFHKNGVGAHKKSTSPVGIFWHLEICRHPPGDEGGNMSERGIARQSPDTVDAEGKVGKGGCVTSAISDISEVGGAVPGDAGRIRGGGGGDATETPPGDPGGRRQERDVDDERSETHGIFYDDDFEDDAQGYSLSDSESGGDGDSVSQKQSQSRTDSGSYANGAAETAEEADFVIPCIEGRQNALAVNTEGLEKRQRQQQLVEEQETAAAIAAQRIQRSARTWVRCRDRLRNKINGDKDCQQESTTKENQEWHDAWRARHHSQVREAKSRQKDQDGEAIRIQADIQRKPASEQVKELRPKPDARKQAAAVKIQAMVRRRTWQRTATMNKQQRSVQNVHLPQKQEVESNRTTVEGSNPAGQEGEQTPAVCSELASVDVAINDRAAVAIQKAIRRRLSSENRTGTAEGLPSRETKGRQQGLEEEMQEKSGVRERWNDPEIAPVRHLGSGAGSFTPSQARSTMASSSSFVASADDGIHSPTSSVFDGPILAAPVSGDDGLDARFDGDDSDDHRRGMVESAVFVETGRSSTGPSPDLAQSKTAVAADEESPQSVSSPDGNCVHTGDVRWRSLHPPAVAEVSQHQQHQQRQAARVSKHSVSLRSSPDHDATVEILGDALPVDTGTSVGTMMKVNVGTHTDICAGYLGSPAVSLSPVPEPQALLPVAASASEYGSEDLIFESLSSSQGSSGSGIGSGRGSGSGSRSSGVRDGDGSRDAEEDAGVAANQAAETTKRAGSSSSVGVIAKKTEEPTQNQRVGGAAAPTTVVVAAADKDPTKQNQHLDGAATGATTKEMESGDARGTGGDSENSSLTSLSVSSGR